MFTSLTRLLRPSLVSRNYPFKSGLKEISFSEVRLLNLHSSSQSVDFTPIQTSVKENLSTDIVNLADKEDKDKLYRLLEVEVRGNDPAVLKSYAWFTTTAAHHLGIEVGKSWTPAKAHHERYTVLRSIHVNKKCRVQYEFRTYFHFMQFLRLTGSTTDTFLEYIQRNLPEGVAMKVTKIALEPLPDHIKEPEKEDLAADNSISSS